MTPWAWVFVALIAYIVIGFYFASTIPRPSAGPGSSIVTQVAFWPGDLFRVATEFGR